MENNKILSARLLKEVKSKLPQGASVASSLMDMLFLGKEAVYRRLRGEVPFTFDEIAKISLKFGVSVDSIITSEDTDQIVQQPFESHASNLQIQYAEVLKKEVEHLQTAIKDGNQKYAGVTNSLPYFFYNEHRELFRFRLYKWIYQMQQEERFFSFSKLVLSEETLDILKMMEDVISLVKKVEFVIDENIYQSFCREIDYFFKQNLISDQEMEVLKKELLSTLSILELISMKGATKKGQKMSLYLSDLPVDEICFYFESDRQRWVGSLVNSMAKIVPIPENLVQQQKRWMDSMKKYSVLITESGEKRRFDFFNKQREIISNL